MSDINFEITEQELITTALEWANRHATWATRLDEIHRVVKRPFLKEVIMKERFHSYFAEILEREVTKAGLVWQGIPDTLRFYIGEFVLEIYIYGEKYGSIDLTNPENKEAIIANLAVAASNLVESYYDFVNSPTFK